ncbi:MAG: DUF5615 family PIN-like protein [Thermoleophilaceae bacterium]
MKLRLDEMVPVRVARGLRNDGFEVDAVVETPALRGLPDAQQLAQAATDERALVSYDAGDLLLLAAQRTASGQGHAGLVLLRSSRFPQGAPDRVSQSLRKFLVGPARPAGFVHWLQ